MKIERLKQQPQKEALLDRNRFSLEKDSCGPNIFVGAWLKNEHIAILLLTSPPVRR